MAWTTWLLRPYGITFSRYEALVLLTFSRRGSLPLSKIGERLQVHATSDHVIRCRGRSDCGPSS